MKRYGRHEPAGPVGDPPQWVWAIFALLFVGGAVFVACADTFGWGK